MYKKIRSHPSPVKVYGEKLINEGSILNDYLNDSIKKFKDLLNEQFENAKDYKPKIEWFEGTWSRYKPEKGKDKRGVTGSDLKKLKEISNKINTITKEMNVHKTISKVIDNRKISVLNEKKNRLVNCGVISLWDFIRGGISSEISRTRLWERDI
jgi:2-oxoglutarate dehydrogenase E1 component